MDTISDRERSRQTVSVLAIGVPPSNIPWHLNEAELKEFTAKFLQTCTELAEANFGTIYQTLNTSVIAIFDTRASEKHAIAAYNTALAIARSLKESLIKPVFGIASGHCLFEEASGDARRYLNVSGQPVLLAAAILYNSSHPLGLCRLTHDLIGNPLFSKSVCLHSAFDHTEVRYFDEIKPLNNQETLFSFSFLGRDSELSALKDIHYDVFKTRKSANLWISGPAGVGKTRLVSEYLRSLKPAAIVRYTFLPNTENTWVFYKTLLQQCLELTGIEAQNEYPAEIIRYVHNYYSLEPSSYHLLEFLLSGRETPEWKGLSHKARQHLIASIVARVLTETAQISPLLIVIEDAHWAIDDVAVFCQEFFSLRNCSAFLLVTSREAREHHLFTDRFINIRLENLKEAEIFGALSRLVNQNIYSPEERADFVKHMHSVSSGNPLFLTEVITYLKMRGHLSETSDGFIFEKPLRQLDIPANLKALIQHQMDMLDSQTRETLHLLSLMGYQVDRELVQKISKTSPKILKDAINQLIHANFLVADQGSENGLIFRHEAIQKAVFECLPERTRLTRHKEIFAKIKSIPTNTFTSKLSRTRHLAHHATSARLYGQAYRYTYQAGRLQLALYHPQDADKSFAACLELLDAISQTEQKKDIRRARLLVHQAQKLFLTADFETLAQHLKLIAGIPSTDAPASIHQDYLQIKASLEWVQGDYRKALGTLEACRKVEVVTPEMEVTYLLKRAGIYSDMGEFKAGIKLAMEAKTILESQPPGKGISNLAFPPLGACYAIAALSYAFLGEQEAAREYISHALEAGQKQQAQSSRIFVLCFCGHALFQMKDYRQAYSLLEEAQQLSERQRIDVLLSYTQSLLGLTKVYLGKRGGLELLHRAIETALREQRVCRLPLLYSNLAEGYYIEENYFAAKSFFGKALSLARKHDEKAVEAKSLHFLMKIHGSKKSKRKTKDLLSRRLNRLLEAEQIEISR